MGNRTQKRKVSGNVQFEDVWAMFQETDQMMKETARRQKETDRQMKETDRRLDKMMAETDKKLGKLGNRLGELVEHLVTPNMVEKFRALGYAFTKAGPGIEFYDSKGKPLAEVDVWLENGEFALAVEVKSCLHIQDIKDHVRRMETLCRYAEERNDKRKFLAAAAGAIVRQNVREYAVKNGFYVIEQSGDTVKIEVPEGFRPRIWQAFSA
ncbi:MAG: hypothetical protein LBK64_03185 [Spirochaetaceae bacterium]|nr:hypothetical protein [Spirochaetaceae bacterium]